MFDQQGFFFPLSKIGISYKAKNEQPDPVAHSIKCTCQPATKFFNGAGLSTVILVRTTGLEPARRRHQNLNLARLPIPPCPQISQKKSCFAGFGPRRRQLFNLPQDTPARRVFYRDAQGAFPQNKKSQTLKRICGLNEASGIRTPDNLIKSQVLYQLS